jgi:glycosyltransferase involved in cell wall biosynthesis
VSRGALIFCHPSDEHYGADRILLDIFDVLPERVRETAEFWVPTDLPHGVSPLCEALRERGAVVHHVEMPILRRADLTPTGLGRLLARAWRFRRRLKAVKPVTVYCTTSAAFLCAPIARSMRVRHVVGHVQELWSPSEARLLGVLARSCHRLVAISSAVLEALPTALQGRSTVVPNATPDPGVWSSATPHEPPLRFLMAGRWNRWKGHGTLLQAWDQLEEPGELVILGGPPASGEAVDVAGFVATLRHPETVRVVGEVEDPSPFVEAADIVLVPSDEPEPFGLVAIEAFARGRPVVASAAGGLVEIVTEGHDGWLFRPRDSHHLAEVLRGLTAEHAHVAGAAARETYEKRFTSERYATDWTSALSWIPGIG